MRRGKQVWGGRVNDKMEGEDRESEGAESEVRSERVGVEREGGGVSEERVGR